MKSKAKNHIKKILKRKNSITLSTVFGQKPTHKIFLKTLLSIVFNFKIVTKLNSINFFQTIIFYCKIIFFNKMHTIIDPKHFTLARQSSCNV